MERAPRSIRFDTWGGVDPQTLQRLWPVIDVYGRIVRALAEQGDSSDLRRGSRPVGKDTAA